MLQQASQKCGSRCRSLVVTLLLELARSCYATEFCAKKVRDRKWTSGSFSFYSFFKLLREKRLLYFFSRVVQRFEANKND